MAPTPANKNTGGPDLILAAQWEQFPSFEERGLCYMSYSVSSPKGVRYGITQGSIIGVSRGDIRNIWAIVETLSRGFYRG